MTLYLAELRLGFARRQPTHHPPISHISTTYQPCIIIKRVSDHHVALSPDERATVYRNQISRTSLAHQSGPPSPEGHNRVRSLSTTTYNQQHIFLASYLPQIAPGNIGVYLLRQGLLAALSSPAKLRANHYERKRREEKSHRLRKKIKR